MASTERRLFSEHRLDSARRGNGGQEDTTVYITAKTGAR